MLQQVVVVDVASQLAAAVGERVPELVPTVVDMEPTGVSIQTLLLTRRTSDQDEIMIVHVEGDSMATVDSMTLIALALFGVSYRSGRSTMPTNSSIILGSSSSRMGSSSRHQGQQQQPPPAVVPRQHQQNAAQQHLRQQQQPPMADVQRQQQHYSAQHQQR